MQKALLTASATAAIVFLANSTESRAANNSPATGSYILSGTVQSSTPTGTATCPTSGDSLAGGEVGYVVNNTGKPKFVVVVQASGLVNAVIYLLNQKYVTVDNQKFSYAQPPQFKGVKGTFSLTPVNASSFTLETKTGSLGPGSGTCDTVYSMSLTPGVPDPLNLLFLTGNNYLGRGKLR